MQYCAACLSSTSVVTYNVLFLPLWLVADEPSADSPARSGGLRSNSRITACTTRPRSEWMVNCAQQTTVRPSDNTTTRQQHHTQTKPLTFISPGAPIISHCSLTHGWSIWGETLRRGFSRGNSGGRDTWMAMPCPPALNSTRYSTSSWTSVTLHTVLLVT